jgi:uncharacterized protein YdcH (DUF465 family)
MSVSANAVPKVRRPFIEELKKQRLVLLDEIVTVLK